MQGILPLVEAFLAFALTMLALSMGVSAILSAWQRIRGWRRQGMQHLVEYFYRNEMHPFLEEIRAEHFKDQAPPADLAPWLNAPGKEMNRRKFVVDMISVPTPAGGKDGEDDADPSADDERDRELSKRGGSRRLLEHLPADEVLGRLRASRLGKALRKHVPWGTERTFEELAERFAVLAKASSEVYARRMRIRSVIVGFLVAFALNVDSVRLLDRYIGNPSLRQEVIAANKDLVGQAENPEQAFEEGKVEQGRAEEALAQAAALSERVADALARVKDDEALAVVREALGVEAQQIEVWSRSFAETAKRAEGLRQASEDTRRVLAGLSESFPVGWDAYPNCFRTTPDPRCQALFADPEAIEAAVSDGEATPAREGGLFSRMGWIIANSVGTWTSWLAGVLLTGLLVGLGTPFWVEMVKNFMRLRGWLRGYRSAQPKA